MTKKPKVVFISHLKPAEDVRSYYKMAKSLNADQFELHIIGPGIQLPKNCNSIQFHLTGEYSNGLIARTKGLLKALKYSLKLKPDIIIPNHTELLYVAFINKIIFGTKIGYDLQENTIANAKYAAHLSLWKRAIASSFYTVSEHIAKWWVDQYFIAEVIYKQELKLPAYKSITVLNTFKPIEDIYLNRQDSDRYKLLYCGTIARIYGVLQAIELSKQLHQVNNNYQLIIIGFTPDKLLLKEVINSIKYCSFIQLKTDSFPIPYPTILNEMKNAGMVVMPYQLNKAIQDRIPTKWYECRAMCIPMLIAENAKLQSLASSDDVAIFHSFNEPDVRALDLLIRTKAFHKKPTPDDSFWKNDGERFEKATRQLLNS